MDRLYVVGDGHIDRSEVGLADFLRFLDQVKGPGRTLCILGDLFDVWLGIPKLLAPYHRRVLDKLHEVRAAGTVVKYAEGNRDFFLARFQDRPFAQVGSEHLEEEIGGRRLFLAHGDLVNSLDRQYLLWRRFSKTSAGRLLMTLLPGAVGRRLAYGLEAWMRGRNLNHKMQFPEAECLRFCRSVFKNRYDAVVFGHFHQERRLVLREDDQERAIYILPAWKESRRYLVFDGRGQGWYEGLA